MAEAVTQEKFPRTFYVANGIELFERLAFYGVFVTLSIYLTDVVGFDDKGSGRAMGNYRLVASIAPIVCGAIADRISFKRSLLVAFTLYAFSYGGLLLFPVPTLATLALMGMAVAGGFMKPVITGTVVRTAPPGREAEGFALFYRMINAGSVIGKTLAYGVRLAFGLKYVLVDSVIASLLALGLAGTAYTEPERGRAKAAPLSDTLRGYGTALGNWRFALFLVLYAGFYFMVDQFYFTFPKYVTRHIDAKAPLEIITLINPALIALFQSRVTRLFANVHPLTTMVIGMGLASLSMLVMGYAPGLWGACLSGGIFACAEMTCSPRFYGYVASFAPEGKAGMYMGLAFVPPAIGGFIGGRVSGDMVARYIPADGVRDPRTAWTTYAMVGVGCMALLAGYRFLFGPRAKLSAS